MITELRPPTSLEDCRPDQLSKWAYLVGDGVNLDTLSAKLDFRVQVVSIFTGISRKKLEAQTDYRLINQVFTHLISILATDYPNEPKGEVIVEGEKFVFDKEFKRKQTGQIIDLKLIENVWDNPNEVLSILYVEDGRHYNETDDYDNILNPSDRRAKLFKEHFPGDEFMSVWAFFLSSWEKRSNAIWALNMAKTKIQMENLTKEMKQEIQELSGTNGQRT